ncbi:phosphatidate cytidylyltransferase [Clavibacter phaseoli]|uniref:Phosphatidate cytidylyltransferase n=2 Tax=Clavibacter phaseoli TaxID=1734031 RepID=A0A8I0S7Y5_9MICO|nr:phosphatidate cytidylyltransferase [Clavibacter phaseoli]MBM7388609.1 phosphatidate cytidylyltransferase [Clavibacter michiganensis]MBF4629951.1 phosphatidate cytidylyltransferase [Clavibacter phaseoli]MCJ1710831.1 phosphatidate cytidylyltransferase [Clavibacter phaseoli]RIJ59791.1 phosphatidate cytidylyltransferase [Clavibacter phaseoli]UKF30801.1 phosphatidate cytidylyltransferase [Clavibacter phaseoli]
MASPEDPVERAPVVPPASGPDGAPRIRRHRGRVTRAEFEAQVQATRADLTAQVRATRASLEATNDRINARTGRNLLFAVTVGLLLGGVVLVSLVVVKQLFLLIAVALVAFTAYELATALRQAGRRVPRVGSVIAVVALVPITYYGRPDGQWLGLLGAMAFVALWRVVEQAVPARRTPVRALVGDVGSSVFLLAYVGLLGSFAVLLTAGDGGEWWTLAFLILVVCSDTGAYVAGLNFGKHPMAPTISPKKTWEGFAGAVVAAVLAGILLSLFMIQQEWWFGIVLGLVIVVTATLGDLAESLIKRDLGVKDISSWLPGHGGFLDRLDSVLPSAAVAYALFLIVTGASS